MRRLQRQPLPPDADAALQRRQQDVPGKLAVTGAKATKIWDTARRSSEVKTAHRTLCAMAGECERCMYCEDSQGTDIEHFWPKSPYPGRLFVWTNLLLCCTHCGRYKGDRFPIDGATPLLIDPTAEDPWQFLDFEPATGSLTARFDVTANQPFTKGAETVDVLHLDRREALSRVYLRNYRRICDVVRAALTSKPIDAGRLVRDLEALDDHGLLAWCFSSRGKTETPFSELHRDDPAAWRACETRFA